MNKTLLTIKYLLLDFASAAMAWALFYAYRKVYIESFNYNQLPQFINDRKLDYAIIFIPLFWIVLYTITGTYFNIYRKSRLKELGQTLYISLIGVLIIFFTLLLDDSITNYKTYYHTVFVLLGLHFGITELFRFLLSSNLAHKIQKRIIGFNTILVGSSIKAINLFNEFESQKISQGNKFIGYVHVDETNGSELEKSLKHLGSINDIEKFIKELKVEEIIIAIESSEHESLRKIINLVEDSNVIIKILPDMYDILSGSVKMNAIFGAPLIEIYPSLMPTWEKFTKRAFDICFSLFVLIFLSPIYILTAIGVKLSSKGPILYYHERIGIHGMPFTIYKFRSMYINAENGTPQPWRSRRHHRSAYHRHRRLQRQARSQVIARFLLGPARQLSHHNQCSNLRRDVQAQLRRTQSRAQNFAHLSPAITRRPEHATPADRRPGARVR